MRLECSRCKRIIEPEDQMVVVVVDQPAHWTNNTHVANRLAHAPSRWHYRCVPMKVRQYASALSAGGTKVFAALAAGVMYAIVNVPGDAIETLSDLLTACYTPCYTVGTVLPYLLVI